MRYDVISRADNAYSHADYLKLFTDDGLIVRFIGFVFFAHKEGESFFDCGNHVGSAVGFGAFVILIGQVFCEVGHAGFFRWKIDILSGKSCLDTIVIVISVGRFSFVRCGVDLC